MMAAKLAAKNARPYQYIKNTMGLIITVQATAPKIPHTAYLLAQNMCGQKQTDQLVDTT